MNVIYRKPLFLLILILSLSHSVIAQSYLTKKTATGKALKLFEKAEEQSRYKDFDAALKTLEKLIDQEPEFVDALTLRAAISYDRKIYDKAETDLTQALSLAPDYKPRSWYQLGLTKMRQDKYAEAVTDFENFLQREDRSENMRKRAARHLANCQFAAEAIKNPVPFNPKSIGENINTEGFEYLPSITADGGFLVYTTRIKNQEDLYYSKKVDGQWETGKPMEAINTPLNEATQTLSADGRFLVYTACNRKDGYGGCDLYFSEMKNDRWTRPLNIGAPINTKAWDSQPTLSASGTELYFASERGGGQGEKDLWVSYRNKDGRWSKPENLGDVINTSGNEQAPFIHPDGRTLYFMSDGHPGMGDYDLFYSKKDEQGNWTKPKNLGYPINTPAHEGALFVDLLGKTAYFASDKDYTSSDPTNNRRTTTDIYYFELHPEARPQPVTYVKAKVRDQKTQQLIQANAEIIDLETGLVLFNQPTTEKGSFLITLPSGKDYALNVSKENYLFHSENFQLKESTSTEKPYLLEIDLVPISKEETPEKAKPVVLRNVFFETGSAALLAVSKVELDRLKSLLERNTDLKIKINGHTDNVGSEEDNLQLSEARAKAVRDYLIESGIADNRLQYEGFGETVPIDSNETEAGRSNNRRTEFEIIK
jgi:outer membrane protein OmpA-like peptidoglycan-associated protein/cytochrome c-type biogenesis protein CcmH/NrfG